MQTFLIAKLIKEFIIEKNLKREKYFPKEKNFNKQNKIEFVLFSHFPVIQFIHDENQSGINFDNNLMLELMQKKN